MFLIWDIGPDPVKVTVKPVKITLKSDKEEMGKVMIIGAGGVGTVVAHKCAMHPEVFTEIVLASRTQSKCDAISAKVADATGVRIATDRVDADSVPELCELFRRHRPELVINVALPYQDLTIMEACLE